MQFAMLKITDSVPAPKPSKRKGRKGDGRQEAILALKTGESFFLQSSINSAGVLKWWARNKFPDREYAAKKEADGVRIWRTK